MSRMVIPLATDCNWTTGVGPINGWWVRVWSLYQKRWSSVRLKPFGQRCAGNIFIFCWFGATRASACQAEAQVSVMPAQVSGRGCKNPRFQSATRASACQVEAQVTVFWTKSFFDQGWPWYHQPLLLVVVLGLGKQPSSWWRQSVVVVLWSSVRGVGRRGPWHSWPCSNDDKSQNLPRSLAHAAKAFRTEEDCLDHLGSDFESEDLWAEWLRVIAVSEFGYMFVYRGFLA